MVAFGDSHIAPGLDKGERFPNGAHVHPVERFPKSRADTYQLVVPPCHFSDVLVVVKHRGIVMVNQADRHVRTGCGEVVHSESLTTPVVPSLPQVLSALGYPITKSPGHPALREPPAGSQRPDIATASVALAAVLPLPSINPATQHSLPSGLHG